MPAMAVKAAPLGAIATYLPNDALHRDAGEFAAPLARVFPRPHAPYFEGDRARRLLIGWLAYNQNLGPQDAEALAAWSLRRVLERYAPETPPGLIEALRRAEGPWGAYAMEGLITLLKEAGDGLKVLRHAQTLAPRLVFLLELLLPALRRPRIIAVLKDENDAALLTEAITFCWGASPDAARLRRLAQRLERAPSSKALFAWLVEELGLERLAPPPLPPTDWLRPILSVADIERTALQYKNCLRTRIPAMLRGLAAYYEVLGAEPAIVELVTHPHKGWVLGEVRGHANKDVSGGLRAHLTAHLDQYGAGDQAEDYTIAARLAVAAGW